MFVLVQFYTVVACQRDADSDPDIWQTPESWLEVDDDVVLWAHYPFRNRQSCDVRQRSGTPTVCVDCVAYTFQKFIPPSTNWQRSWTLIR